MYEDNAIRAIIIGVSVFIFVITISTIILYYNAAVEAARVTDTTRDYSTIYTKTIDELNGTVVTGTEARNILRQKYTEYTTVTLELDSVNIGMYKDTFGNIKDEIFLKIKLEKKYTVSLINNTGTLAIQLTTT